MVTGTCFAETGNHVICVDIDRAKVEKMKNGEVPIYEPHLDVIFERNIRQNQKCHQGCAGDLPRTANASR